jgi:hypothetical protein
MQPHVDTAVELSPPPYLLSCNPCLALGLAEGGLLELLLAFAAGSGAGGFGGGGFAGGALYFLALDLVGDAGGICHCVSSL